MQTSQMLLGNPILLGMDAGQIFGCLIVGGIFLGVVRYVQDLFSNSTERNKLIAEYIFFVIGVAILFSVGLLVGRQ